MNTHQLELTPSQNQADPLVQQEQHKCQVLHGPNTGVHRFFQNHSPLKILGTRTVTWNKSHTEDPQILGTTIQNFVTMATSYLGFVHTWFKIIYGITVWRKKQLLEGKIVVECKTLW